MKRKGREIELWLFKKGIATRSNEAMKSQFMQKVQQALEEHRSTDLDDIFPIIPLDVQSRIKDSMPLIKLKQARMLQGINKDVLKMICRKLEPKRYTGNEIIIQKDQALENMLFIVDGNVLIKKGSNDSDDSKRGAGELCGEELLRWPFSTSFPRKKPSATESVQATSVVEALALKACDLESIYNQSSITSIEKPRHRRLMKEEIEQNIDLLMPRNEIPRRLNNDEKSWIMKMVEQQFQEGKVVYWDRLYSDWDELKVVLIPNLTTLAVHQCDSLRFLFSSSMAKCLGQLKHLTISKCQALQMVYDTSSTTQVNGFECPNLHFVDIDSCDSLKNVFPASVAKDLKQLKMLKVKNCDLLEEIVAKKEGPEKAYEEFEFPKVTFMEFHNLPQLGSFYPGLHVSNWPSLNILKFTKCGGVEILPAKFSTYQDKLELGHPRPTKQPFFLMEKDKSFLNLERLVLDENTEILYGPLLAELLRKLKGIGFATSHPKSDDFFENLQNIEELHVFSAPWKELIVHNHQGSSSGEIHEGKTLPRVKGLWLGNMPELIHLGKENSQPGCPVFPNLEFLCLEKCGRLENLASTLISFWNLTTLTILDCHGLQYLIPYSVAKNLQQLKKLVVKSCERMVEIVASNENDSENEITFNCLKHLQLSGLPSLQGFCTGNCIFKVPSLPTLIVEDCQLIKLKISPDGLLQSDPRPERQQIAEETDDVLKLSDSKENDRDQTDQLMIADTN